MPKVSTADRVARPEDDLHWVYHTSSSVLFICSLTCEQLSNDRVYMDTNHGTVPGSTEEREGSSV